MTHSLPFFYGNLPKVESVEILGTGATMKDFLKAALVLGMVLALGLSARVAAYAYLHSDATDAKRPTSVAAADSGCAARQVKFPCLQHTDSRS